MKHEKIKSASKPTSPINLLRGAIGQKNSKHLKVALDAFKTEGETNAFSRAYLLASSSPHFSGVFPAAKNVTNQGSLGVANSLEVGSLSREVQWAAVVIHYRRETLNLFVQHRAAFFSAFVAGRFDVAAGALDAVVDDCGHSSWEIENRVALLTVSGGFEKQKKYVQQLTRERGRSNVSFITTLFGERNEPRVTANAFQQQFRNRSKTWQVDESQKAYFSYKLTNRIDSSENSYSAILAHEGTWSIIDLYESLLEILRRSKSEKFFVGEIAFTALDFLDVTDRRIGQLREFLADTDEGHGLKACNPSLALFHAGKFPEALAAARNEIEADACDLTAVQTYAKLRNEVEDTEPLAGWLAASVERALSSIYLGTGDTAQAADELVKLSINLRHAEFAQELTLPITGLTDRGVAERKLLVRSSTVYRASPFRSAHHMELWKPDSEWTPDARAYHAAEAAMSRQDWAEALRETSSLEKSELRFYRTTAAYLSAHLSLKLLRTEEALQKAVELFVENPASIIFTPLIQISRANTFRDLKSMESNVALACAFYIFALHTGSSEKEVALKVAWKKYLASRGVDRPSSLMAVPSLAVTSLEVFFLSQVCKQETMELGGAFSKQMDLDRERMKICIALAQVDSGSLTSYDNEIVELTRRISIEEGVQYLESSRVFVDEIGILSWAKKNLQSQFLRYKDYLKAGMFSSAREIERKIVKLAVKSKNRKAAIESYLDDYDVSAESLLEEIVVRLADAFLSRPRFGLDAFLSSRVRHGSFVGYLRGPLELKHFITKKNSSTGRYFENDFILNEWGIVAVKERNNVNSKLVHFSTYVDSLLDDAVSKFLHVRSKARPEGMVAFSGDAGGLGLTIKRWLLVLKSTIDEDSTLEELVNHCIQNLFWPSVKLSLDRLQSYVKNNLGHELTYAIDSLADDVRPILDESNRSALLRDRYYVKQDIKTAIDRVAQWFDAPKDNTQMLHMSLPRAIEIGLESTKNARPSFNPTVQWEVDPGNTLEVYGPAIGMVNDIAFLIFANISKHSGFEEADLDELSGPRIKVIVRVDENSIVMDVRSEISLRKDLAEVRIGIESAASKIANREFDSVTQNNSGTGLVRLAIMCEQFEGERSESLHFGLADERTFFVRVQIARGLIDPIRQIELAA